MIENGIVDVKFGNIQIDYVYLGNNLIWENKPPEYIPFEDSTVHTMCATRWGDYNETVITDNGDNTVNIVVTYKSMLNTTLKKSKIISSESNVDNTGGEYTPGTTKTAVGMTLAQCAAVTNISTIFKNNKSIRKFNEFQYFTSITSLSNSAFASSGIAEITFPTSLRTIGGTGNYANVFQSCTNLTQMILNEGVTSVGDRWLWGARNIKLIDFPSTITAIRGYGIQPYATNQVNFNIICRAVTPSTLGSSSYLTKLVKVYVPDNSVDTYKAANKWKDFATKIVGLSTYTG